MSTVAERPDCACEEEEFKPRPYAELPPEIQAKAQKWYTDHAGELWDSFDAEDLTECLVEILDYEYGIDVTTTTRKGHQGKTYQEPDVHWNTYPTAADFKACLDIDKLLAHGVPGCEYYSEKAAELARLWQAVQVLEAVGDNEYDFTFRLDSDGSHVEWHNVTREDARTVDDLADAMQGVLNDIYRDACCRLKQSIDAQMDWYYSDERAVEELEANDHWEFDEEGARV